VDGQVESSELPGADRVVARKSSTHRTKVASVVLVVLLVAAGAIWWANQGDDMRIGSRHRATVMVQAVEPGGCQNNIGSIRVGSRGWNSDAHAPDAWGVGEVSGWLEVTAPPSLQGPTATFTADAGGAVPLYGGFEGSNINLLNCSVAG
jgi:hypothetical protein